MTQHALRDPGAGWQSDSSPAHLHSDTSGKRPRRGCTSCSYPRHAYAQQSDEEPQGTPEMRFYGHIYQEGPFWLVEVPVLDAMTQGRTPTKAFARVKDLLETLANRPGFAVQVHPGHPGHFELSASDAHIMVSLLLRRQRERSGLSQADMARRLGAQSRNAYARYKRGTFMPTVEKLQALLQAVSPDQDLVLHQSGVA